MTDLSDLIERVRKAEGTDRQLDYALFCHFAPMEVASAWHPLHGHKYTSSLDAITALIEKKLPGAKKSLTELVVGWSSSVLILDAVDGSAVAEDFHADAPTAPLALCLAFLLAIQSQDTDHDQ